MKKKAVFVVASLLSLFAISSCAKDGLTPYIGENGNWWIGDEDQGISAQGPKGDTGDLGEDGKNGNDGVSVVSVSKTNSQDNIDTYTIKYSNNTSTTFTVTNGLNGKNGEKGADADPLTIKNVSIKESTGNVDTYEIEFSDGYKTTFVVTNGVDGEDLTVLSIAFDSSDGLYDTYKINFSDESSQTFIVKNGEDGKTPYIGENGNWWIGTEDTGVLADYERLNDIPLTIYSNGLQYKFTTFNGITGLVVTGWSNSDFENYLQSKYTEEELDEIYDEENENRFLVIPNYVGSFPVIGIAGDAKLNFNKVTLSNNTMFLGANAFQNCSHLREIDFHNSKINSIPENCFFGTKINSIALPETVTHIYQNAFKGCELKEFDFTNIKYIEANAFDTLYSPYVYLTKNVEYVGAGAFASTRVYIEHETYPTTWSNNITSTNALNKVVSVNCKMNDEYIYSINSNNVTVYQYIGNQKEIEVPSKIDDKNVTNVGFGFACAPFKTSKVWSEIYQETGDKYSIVDLKEVRLPETLVEINPYSFICAGTMVMIPSSVTKICRVFLGSVDDPDDVGLHFDDLDFYIATNHFAFEGASIEVYGDDSYENLDEILNNDNLENRISFNNDFDKIEHDELFYYISDGLSYSVRSYMGFGEEELIIPSSFNEKPIKTVMSCAISGDLQLKSITIESGITTIRPYAIYGEKLTNVYIPNTVTLINKYGVYINSDTYIYVEASSKPLDWDSNWTNKLDNVYFNVGELKQNNEFVYSIKDNKVTLLKYTGSSTNLYLPSTVDGYSVEEIRSGFYNSKRGAALYIPSSVTKIEKNAFKNSSSNQFKVYCEITEQPSSWDSDWFSGTNTIYWNQTTKFNYLVNDNYAYLVDGNNITLLAYYGNDTIVYVPRTIDNKIVNRISSYCYSFNGSVSIYIPNEIIYIESNGIENTVSKTINVYCETASKPSTWNSYAFYNAYHNSTSYFSFKYSTILDY